MIGAFKGKFMINLSGDEHRREKQRRLPRGGLTGRTGEKGGFWSLVARGVARQREAEEAKKRVGGREPLTDKKETS